MIYFLQHSPYFLAEKEKKRLGNWKCIAHDGLPGKNNQNALGNLLQKHKRMVEEAKRERRDRFQVLGDIWNPGADLEPLSRFGAVGQIWSCGTGLQSLGRFGALGQVWSPGANLDSLGKFGALGQVWSSDTDATQQKWKVRGDVVLPHAIPRAALGIPAPGVTGGRMQSAWHSTASLPFLPEEPHSTFPLTGCTSQHDQQTQQKG